MSKLPPDITPPELEKEFDRLYFVWNGRGEAKGYRGTYADFPENLKFLEYIKSLKPESVLEAGCAYAFLVKRLNDAGIPAVGFDASSFAYKMRVTDKMQTASVLNLSCFRDKQFDLAVSIELLEHIPEAHVEKALRELARVSKRGVHWIAYKEVDDLFKTKDVTHICFPKNTWISLSDGTVKPINAIKVGDIVLGEFEGTVVPTVVKHAFSRLYSGDLFHILLDNQLELMATPDHPIKTENGWTPINKLNIGVTVYTTYAKMGEVDGTRFGVPQNELSLNVLQGDWHQNRQNARLGTSQSQKFKTTARERQISMERRGNTNSKGELRKINTQGTFSSPPKKKMDNDIGQGKQGGASKIGKAGVPQAPRANLTPRNYKSVHSGTYRWRGLRRVRSEQSALVQSDPANIQFRQEDNRLRNSITSTITKRQEDATAVYTEYTKGKGLHKNPLYIKMAGLQTNPHTGGSPTLFNSKEKSFGDCLDLLPYSFKETKEHPIGGRREEYILGMAKLMFKTWENAEGESVYNLETETNNYFANGILVHNCIKPYQWWADKVREVCGPEHKVVHKETDWYPKPVVIPQGGQKKGLNVGSFVNMILNTEDTVWLNVDILDLEKYAQAYGYNFKRMDAQKLPFPDNSFDYMVCSHFLEHLTPEEGVHFLQECHRVLKPDGVMRLAVPDAYLLTKLYLENKLEYFDEVNPECEKEKDQLAKLNALLWGGHKAAYDAPTLSYTLQKAGFKPSRQTFNVSSRPDLMKQVFDYHADLSLFCEGTPIKKEKPVTVGPHKEGLRIAILSTPFLMSPPLHYGGLERVCTDLAAGLAELGQDVTLFAAKGSKPLGDYEVFETVNPVFKFSTDWGKVDWFKKEREHYMTFKDRLKEFDIVHGHGWFGFEYLAKRDGLASHVCHTHHGGLNWKTKPCEKMNLIAISKFMADIYARQLNTHVHWVYNGIDTNAYPFKKEKGDRLIFVGRFTSFKQPHIAIEVAKRLGMGLDLVGGAYEEPYFSQQVKPNCDGKQIVLHTEVAHQRKVELLQNAKALLFPSRMNEPFGLCLVEANSCGTPVIGSRDGAIPEIVVEGVSGFVRDDVEGLVEAVKRVGEIKPENCRALVEQNFTCQIMARRYEKLYRDILAGSEW